MPPTAKGRRAGGGTPVELHLHDATTAIGDSTIFLSAQPSADPVEPPAPPQARKRAFGLRGIVLGSTVATALLLLVLCVYYAAVMLNLTFTFAPHFGLGDVPFYNLANTPTAWKYADRLGMWWWFVALSLLRVASVVGTNMALTNAALTGQTGPLIAMRVWIALYGLYDGATGIYFVAVGHTVGCSRVPVCRNWAAEKIPDGDSLNAPLPASDSEANWVFLLMAWFTLAFIGVHVALGHTLKRATSRVSAATRAAIVDSENKGV